MGRSFRLQNGFGNHCNVRRHPPIGEGKRSRPLREVAAGTDDAGAVVPVNGIIRSKPSVQGRFVLGHPNQIVLNLCATFQNTCMSRGEIPSSEAENMSTSSGNMSLTRGLTLVLKT